MKVLIPPCASKILRDTEKPTQHLINKNEAIFVKFTDSVLFWYLSNLLRAHQVISGSYNYNFDSFELQLLKTMKIALSYLNSRKISIMVKDPLLKCHLYIPLFPYYM
jgi:hypothetical protein